MRVSSNSIIFYLCILTLLGACRDATNQIRMMNIEVTQDIRSSGRVDISSKIKFPMAPSEINVCFNPNIQWMGLGSAEKFGIRLNNQYGQYIEAGYDVYHQLFFIECRHSSDPEVYPNIQVQLYSIDEAKTLDMRIILKPTSIELFSLDGTIELSSMYFYSSEFNKMELYAENGKVYVESVSLSQL